MHTHTLPGLGVLCLLTLMVPMTTVSVATAAEHPNDQLVSQLEELKALREPFRKEHFEKLLPILEANAAAWLEYEALPYPGIDDWLLRAKYDDASYDDLAEIVKTARRTDEQLYVLNRLLLPTTGDRRTDMATPEQAKKLVDIVDRTARRYKPRKVPTVSAAQARRLQLPEADNLDKADSEDIMRKIGSVERARAIKLKRERPLAKNNEGLWDLELKVYRLRILAAVDDDREMRKIIEDAEKMVRDRNIMFKEIVDMVGEIGSKGLFSKEVGERWYDLIKTVISVDDREFWRNKWQSYCFNIRLDGESDYLKENIRADLLASEANRFAEKIGKPKLSQK